MIAGPGRHVGVIGQQQARHAGGEGAQPIATRISPETSSAQNRAATAGSSMMPTAIKVPSAWNPATRLSTTSTRKMRWVGELQTAGRAQELRIETFEHQRRGR